LYLPIQSAPTARSSKKPSVFEPIRQNLPNQHGKKWRNSADSGILKNMAKPGITKQNTVESFIKANSTLRVGADAVTFFLNQLDTLSETVVKTADATAKQAGRTTIMVADIKAGLSAATGSTSDLAFLFKQIEALSAKDTADLSELIRRWIETH
jgi:histone H3/H4